MVHYPASDQANLMYAASLSYTWRAAYRLWQADALVPALADTANPERPRAVRQAPQVRAQQARVASARELPHLQQVRRLPLSSLPSWLNDNDTDMC